MIRLALAMVFAMCLACAAVAARGETPPQGKQVSILFVGNSYTQVNSLDRLVPALTSVSPGRPAPASAAEAVARTPR